MLSLRDQRELDFYYSVGQSAFEKSTFGAILEHQRTYYVKRLRNAPEITARPTAELRDHGGYEIEEYLLVLYGSISRRLRKCSPTSQVVLERWHGDLGARYARSDAGRSCALFALTQHGKELLARERQLAKGALLECSDTERLLNAIALDRLRGSDSERSRLIKIALVESKRLYTTACEEYCNA